VPLADPNVASLGYNGPANLKPRKHKKHHKKHKRKHHHHRNATHRHR
jgi:hypothetical protein